MHTSVRHSFQSHSFKCVYSIIMIRSLSSMIWCKTLPVPAGKIRQTGCGNRESGPMEDELAPFCLNSVFQDTRMLFDWLPVDSKFIILHCQGKSGNILEGKNMWWVIVLLTQTKYFPNGSYSLCNNLYSPGMWAGSLTKTGKTTHILNSCLS